MVILSSALFKNYLTLLVVATYVIAPVPNWICGKAQQQDDFMDNSGNSIVELGRFLTGFLVVMGIGEFYTVYVEEGIVLISGDSTTCGTGTLRSDSAPSDGYEHRGWTADLWHHYQFYHVLP